MQYRTIALFVSLSTLILAGCGGSGNGTGSDNSAVATLDTAVVNYTGANVQTVFYDFATDSLTVLPHDAWDLAISTTDASVIANSGLYGSGVRLYTTDSVNLSADFSSYADSVGHITDSSENPLAHAFSAQGGGDSSVYLVKDGAGHYYKLQFASFGPAGKFSVKVVSGLAGDSVVDVSGSLQTDEDYVYLDLSKGADAEVTNLFPKKGDWDIRFVRALEFSMGPAGIGAKSAILLNTAGGVQAAMLDSVPFDSVSTSEVSGLNFSRAIDAIGASWYLSNYDMTTHISTVTIPVRTYLVRTTKGDLAKIQFLSFYGPENESFYTVFKSSVIDTAQ